MTAPDDTTTVFALSTPKGRSAIAVVRISGPGASRAITALTGLPPPRPRFAALRRLHDSCTGIELDEALVLWFPGPASFTGEDVAEFHLHGGRAVIAGVLDALAALPEFSPAMPGDFTRRAFYCGKLDLAQAEGLADLIDAETQAQRRQALRQQGGALTAQVEAWRRDLIALMALAEALIDFPDEDLPGGLDADIVARGASLLEALDRQLAQARRGERIRDGFRVALLGAPNAGKSSLLNAVAARDVAIVTEEAGTTRDILEVHLDLGGYAVTLADMAGIRDEAGTVESIGIARAVAWAREADLRIFLIPPGAAMTEDLTALMQPGDIVCASKADLGDALESPERLPISTRTGEGLPTLLDCIASAASTALDETEPALVTRLRHRIALEDCRDALADAFVPGQRPELQAEDLRLAARALGRITGRVDVEDVLDTLFGSLCIGK